jgi:hypothetical protein
VIHKADKFFKVDLGRRTDNISIDRLKPAFMDAPSPLSTSQGSHSPLAPPAPPQPPLSPTAPPFVPSTETPALPASGYLSRAGRTVHPPDRLVSSWMVTGGEHCSGSDSPSS